MQPIEVVKYHNDKSSVYIGRGSHYGNPFPITDIDDRDAVCDKYEKYFNVKINNDPVFFSAIKELYKKWVRDGKLKLGCFCAPERCHGDTIKAYLESYHENVEMLKKL